MSNNFSIDMPITLIQKLLYLTYVYVSTYLCVLWANVAIDDVRVLVDVVGVQTVDELLELGVI